MISAAEYLRSVVRVFPDYADTVIWFAPGPVEYADSKISAELRDSMIAWETAWYAGLDDHYAWRSPEVRRELAREGERLARLLSVEIGDLLEVEFDAPGKSKHRVRGSGAGTNPEAREAFRLMVEEDLEDERQVDQIMAGGAQLRFVSASPSHGRVKRIAFILGVVFVVSAVAAWRRSLTLRRETKN